jgi:beta-glucosidase/6-phospho-beta-glucosidase/beta-galactosidase/ABC-type amino acid transport substrate-binding protein
VNPLPDSFLFGVAISDHQAEAYDERFPPDVWDTWEQRYHQAGLVSRGRATDFWQRWKEDVDYAHRLGCRAFRFSIAWARVEPQPGAFDTSALAHYRTMVEYMRSLGIEPIVTLCHFVWPQHLEDRGGLRSHEFVERFAAYAAQVRRALDPLVHYWITFNEPNILLQGFYKFWFQPDYLFPPGHRPDVPVPDQIETVIVVIRHLFLAHRAAREALRREGGEHNRVSANVFQLGLPAFVQRLIDLNITRLKRAEDWRQHFWRMAERPVLFEPRVDLIISDAAPVNTKHHDVAYFISGLAALVKREAAIEALDTLNGRALALVQGERWEHIAQVQARMDRSRIEVLENYEQALSWLDADRVAAVIADHVVLNGLIHLRDEYRVLDERLTYHPYAIVVEAGHPALLQAIQQALCALQSEPGWVELCRDCFPAHTHAPEPHFDALAHQPSLSTLGRIQERGKVIVGVQRPLPSRLSRILRRDGGRMTTQPGIEHFIGRALAGVIFGDAARVEFRRTQLPKTRSLHRRLRDRIDEWARAWTIFSTFVTSAWWYMGMRGQLPEYLCPPDCAGQLDYVAFDYYFGVNRLTPRQLRGLARSAQRRFDRASIWAGGLYQTLRYYHRAFPELPIIIAENGFAGRPTSKRRDRQIQHHVRAIQHAVNQGIDVRAYCVWSITSNREWGLSQNAASDFGLYYIDMDGDPDLKRQETPSAEAYRKLIANRGVT